MFLAQNFKLADKQHLVKDEFLNKNMCFDTVCRKYICGNENTGLGKRDLWSHPLWLLRKKTYYFPPYNPQRLSLLLFLKPPVAYTKRAHNTV